jgi:cellulose synthase/poly-beta-1,6-N-acetylglucosamine synthase-like glycosyltransferase
VKVPQFSTRFARVLRPEQLAPDLDAVRFFTLRWAVLAWFLLIGVYSQEHPFETGETLLVILFGLLTFIGVTTLSFMLYAWRDAESLAETEFAAGSLTPTLSFSLIVPARHEERVLGATIEQLACQDHPFFEVLVVVGHDDPSTLRVAADAAGTDSRFRIVVDRNVDKNKPKALNVALRECRGEIVGVFDAEDLVAKGLLRTVDQTFQATHAQVVQGATQLTNYRSSWFSARNVLEYFFWFRSRLHYQARMGFIPLGGNTVFVRRSLLDEAGGWDESCLAEDCDLGARLSVRGARTVVGYAPALVTQEETPETIAALLKQRTRWNQGFLQVLRKGDWRGLPLRARLLAAYTLAFPFLQAGSLLAFPLTVALMIALGFPIELAVLSFVPLVPLFVILAVELAGLHTLAGEFGLDVRVRDYARLVLGLVPYQLVLCLAALRAVWREFRGIRNWEKTAHVGAHL